METPLPPPVRPSRFVFGTLIPDKIWTPSHPRKHPPRLRLRTTPLFSLIFPTNPSSPSPPPPPGTSSTNGAVTKKPTPFPAVFLLSPSIQTDTNSLPPPAFPPDIPSSNFSISKAKPPTRLFQGPTSTPSPLSATRPTENGWPQPPPIEQSKSTTLILPHSKKLSKATTIISSRLRGVRTRPF